MSLQVFPCSSYVWVCPEQPPHAAVCTTNLHYHPRNIAVKMTSLAAVLSGIARADAISSLAGAALLAVGFHAVIQSVEFEVYMFHFLGASAASWPLLSGLYTQLGGYDLLPAVGKAALVVATFHVSLLASIGVYRLAFHRCRKFPGPFGSRISRLYATYLSSKKVQYHKELEGMHAKYGDFVRTGTLPIVFDHPHRGEYQH